jgi:hypothetical protein
MHNSLKGMDIELVAHTRLSSGELCASAQSIGTIGRNRRSPQTERAMSEILVGLARFLCGGSHRANVRRQNRLAAILCPKRCPQQVFVATARSRGRLLT